MRPFFRGKFTTNTVRGNFMEEEFFWKQVKSISKKKKITQKMLAEACGTPLSTFKGWIRKNYFPTVIGGFAIAKVLGVSVEYLVTGKERATKKDVEKIRLLLHKAEEKLEKLPG